MSQWTINDVTFEIDMADVEFQEKYENAFEKMSKTEKDLQKTGKMSDITRGYCDMFYRLFDDIFGEGSGDKIFGGKKNTVLCEEVYDSFLAECLGQVKEINAKRTRFANKYKPKRR